MRKEMFITTRQTSAIEWNYSESKFSKSIFYSDFDGIITCHTCITVAMYHEVQKSSLFRSWQHSFNESETRWMNVSTAIQCIETPWHPATRTLQKTKKIPRWKLCQTSTLQNSINLLSKEVATNIFEWPVVPMDFDEAYVVAEMIFPGLKQHHWNSGIFAFLQIHILVQRTKLIQENLKTWTPWTDGGTKSEK